jgi:hypothetical protein
LLQAIQIRTPPFSERPVNKQRQQQQTGKQQVSNTPHTTPVGQSVSEPIMTALTPSPAEPPLPRSQSPTNKCDQNIAQKENNENGVFTVQKYCFQTIPRLQWHLRQ